ncbi:DNA-formamidopyrimidine glycosylase [Mycoplasma sp. 2261]
MPELPEVKVVVKNLNEVILYKKIKDLEIIKPHLFKECSPSTYKNNLRGHEITQVKNKGKHIIFQFETNLILLSHLRMEGKYRYYQKPHENHKHLVAKFVFEDNSELHYLDSRMFGTFYLRNSETYEKKLPLSKVALEPKDTNIEELFEKLKGSESSIKTKLLDQSYVAGFGNIYIDEALFACAIHPLSKSKNIPLDKLKEILEKGQVIMDNSYKLGGTTIHTYESFNNEIGSYQDYLMIHSDRIKSCLKCQNKTIKIKVNGRGTYLCSNCQKEY